MKNVSISLTDQHAAEIEAHVSSGDYASVSEVVRAALREFLAAGVMPDQTQIDRDIAAFLEAQKQGVELIPAQEARQRAKAAITG